MKIRRLDVEGFRSLKETTWCPGDLNVLVGANGSGKSNLLRLLELMAVASRGGLCGHIQSLGGMEPLVWDGQRRGIRFKLKTDPVGGHTDPQSDVMTYKLGLDRLGSGSSYRITEETLASHHPDDREHGEESRVLLERGADRARVLDQTERYLVIPKESMPDEETLLSVSDGLSTTNGSIGLFRAWMASWCVCHDVPPFRDAQIRQSCAATSGGCVEPDWRNLTSVLHALYTNDRDFRDLVDGAMDAALGDEFLGIEFLESAEEHIRLRLRWRLSRREQFARGPSDGVMRFLFLLVVLGNPEPPPLIAIDGPEAGLHPSMLPIVAEVAVEASRRSQVIMTTHSPQFLDAFGDNIPTMTVAECVRGQTKLRVVGPESLAYWLENYSLGALFRSGELEVLPPDPDTP